jgi:uncharacterized membrane protein YgdD (TMEM256/DUF423 family)
VRPTLRRLKNPRTLGALIVGAIAFAALLSFADARKVAVAFSQFPSLFIPLLFGLVVGREAVRMVEWRFLLGPHLRPKWRHTAEAIVSGDFAQILPGGIFFQNYVLKETEADDISTTLGATMVMQFAEALVALLVLAVVSVPGWWWLRWAAVAVMAGFGVFLGSITRPAVLNWLKERGTRSKLSGWIATHVEGLLESIELLLTPWIIVRALALTAASMAFTIAGLYVITRAYSPPEIEWLQVAVIYCFVLAVIVLNPLPADWGVSEALGVVMFTSFRVDPATGLTMMLLLRFSILIGTLLLSVMLGLLFSGDAARIAGWRRYSVPLNSHDQPRPERSGV